MSASTLSITANQGPTTRRRAAVKNPSTGDSDLPPTDAENRDARLTAGDTAAAILRDARRTAPPHQIPAKKSARKPAKPRWLTVVSVVTKNLALLLVLMGFAQMLRLVVFKSGGHYGEDFSVISGDLDGKFAEIERFVKTTAKAMQVQVNAVDRKLEEGIGMVRKEFDERMERKGEEMDLKLKTLDARSDALEKFMDGFRAKSFLSREEFDGFFEEFKKAKRESGVGSGEVTVDEIRHYAMEVVEKEIERHAADGLGMVDWALAAGGGRVLRHSEPGVGGGSVGWLRNRNGVSPEAEKMIWPSFGEPGQCFPLKGGSGFVVIRLRSAIVPEAVTLEHVAKSVSYDRSSAPKHCRVSGWMQVQDSVDMEMGTDKMFLLTEFTYDFEKSNAQTFKVESGAPNLINTIRFDFTSNYGNPSYTCIYRLRVHGHEPSAVPVQP